MAKKLKKNYVLKKTIDGQELRAELTPNLAWSGDEPLLSACRETAAMVDSLDPWRGEPQAIVASEVGRILNAEVAAPPPPKRPSSRAEIVH